MSHPFHLVDYSPWPLFASLALFSFALSIISFMTFASYLAFIGLIPIIIIAILWWRDLIREGIGGFHTLAVQRGLRIGFYLFLLSEIMLFASMFWAFLHSSLSPSVELAMWPPVGISVLLIVEFRNNR
jgi:cytochrome c oxidase subunit 3